MHAHEKNQSHRVKWTLKWYKGEYKPGAVPFKVDMLGENLVTDAGKLLMLQLFRGAAVNGFSGIGIGTNATAASVSDTALTDEVYKAFTETPTESGLITTYETVFGPTEGNINIRELGIKNGPGAGVLITRKATAGNFDKKLEDNVSLGIVVDFEQL